MENEKRTLINDRKDFYLNFAGGMIVPAEIKPFIAQFDSDLDVENDEVEVWQIVIDDFSEFLETSWHYNKENLIYAFYIFFENDLPFIVRVLDRVDNTVIILSCDKKTNRSEEFILERIKEINNIFNIEMIVQKRATYKNIYAILEDDEFITDNKMNNERGKLLYSLIMEKKTEEAIEVAQKFDGIKKVLDTVYAHLESDNLGLSDISDKTDIADWIKTTVEAVEKKEKKSNVIRTVKDYVYEHFDENISLDEIAQMVFFNQAYLGRVFKKETGESFNDFLLSVRMEKAKEYLRDPRYKVYEIGNLVGYKTIQYFYKVFKTHYGVTPSEYRRNCGGG